MRKLRQARRLPVLSALVVGAAVALAAPALTTVAASAGTVAHPKTAAYPHRSGVRPNKIGGLDCNGLSPVQRPAKADLACADPHGGDGGRFEENGHYIGHDEPSVRFISHQRGSGNNVTYTERLPLDPAAKPTVKKPGHDVTHWFELSIAPWMSTTVCDS